MFRRSPTAASLGNRRRVLGDRRRFAGQRRFVDREIHRHRDAAVGRHAIACAEDHDVAGYHVARRDAPLGRLANHVRERRGHLLQRLERTLGPVLLDESEQHREQHDDGDDDRLERVAEQAGQQRGREENQNQDVLELSGERVPRRRARDCLQFVWTESVKPTSGLV